MTLLVRDDDILVHSREFNGREFDRFKGAHDLICQAGGKLLHAPAILVSEIQDFPQCIDYCKAETDAGRMQLELHGYQHVDYASLSPAEVSEHLDKSLEWFNLTFNKLPTRWYTPFGAGADERGAFLNDISSAFGLTLYGVDTERPQSSGVKITQQITHTVRDLRNGLSFDDLCSVRDDTLYHFWQRGSKLERLVEVAKYGSWADAAIFNKALFK